MTDHERFHAAYEDGGIAPWDIGRAQPAIVEAGERGWVRGWVLDIGCGTGENALHFAPSAERVVGVDVVPAAIERAQAKAAERGLEEHARFLKADVLHEAELLAREVEGAKPEPHFDTIIDVGFFHTLSDEERVEWTELLGRLLAPEGNYVMECFSELVPGTLGPRRVSEAEIRETFGPDVGLRVADLERTTLHSIRESELTEVPAWLARIQRM